MKIAIVHYHLQPGGVTRVIENTLQAWEENGNEIEAVAISGRTYPGDRLPNTRVPGSRLCLAQGSDRS